MKSKTVLILGILSLLFVHLAVSAVAAETAVAKDPGIKWYGYEEGMALARTTGKKILLYFHADWCGYCHKMDREVFSREEVAAFMNQHFVPIKIDTDAEKKLAEEYRVTGLPTTWFLDGKGTPIQSLPGYLPRSTFLAYLNYIQTGSYTTRTFRAFTEAN